MNGKDSVSSNPWLQGLDAVLDPDALRRKLRRSPEVLAAYLQRTGVSLADGLETLLEEVFVLGDEGLRVIYELHDRMRSSLVRRFPDVKTYLERLYLKNLAAEAIGPVICLTGLSGVGKSQLLSGFVSLFAEPGRVRFDLAHPELPIERVRYLRIGPRVSDSMIYGALANPSLTREGKGLSRDAALRHLPQWFHNCGVGLLVVDEMQFLTQSSNANSRVTQVLLTLGYLGPKLAFVSNYSLGHRLKRRNDEERQRLLGEPIVLNPEGYQSAFWQELLREYIRVAPRILDLCPDRDAWKLWVYTGGLPRLLRRLIVMAVREQADEKTGVVTIAAIERAYLSKTYAVFRETVETLSSLALSPNTATRRMDLVCPFPDKSNYADLVRKARDRDKKPSPWDPPPNATPTTPESVQHMLNSTLSPGARKVLKELRAGSDSVQRGERNTATVQPLRPGKKLTPDDLYAGLKAVREKGTPKGPSEQQ